MSAKRRHERALRQQTAQASVLPPERATDRSGEAEHNARAPEDNRDTQTAEANALAPTATVATPTVVESPRTAIEQELVGSLEAARSECQYERQQKEALKKKLQEAEQEMSKQTMALEREKRENERQRLHFEGRLKELEQRAGSAHVSRASASVEGEDFPANKATFRIDLYPHQGTFQGKIEHILSHEKRAFSGVDRQIIAEFIHTHLPPLESKAEELQKIEALQKAEEPVVAVRKENTLAPPPLAACLRTLEVVLAGTATRTNLLRDDQYFDVELALDLDKQAAPPQQGWQCQVGIFAKRIDGGQRQNLGAATQQVPCANATPLRVQGLQLQRGTYRLEAHVNMQAAAAKPQTLTAHKLIHVY